MAVRLADIFTARSHAASRYPLCHQKSALDSFNLSRSSQIEINVRCIVEYTAACEWHTG